jgi:uncharacterized membrane protein YhiD involved in acid resistance
MDLSPKVLHLVAVCAAALVYLSTDQEFISMLTLAQQHWLHICVGLLVYLGVSQVNRAQTATVLIGGAR